MWIMAYELGTWHMNMAYLSSLKNRAKLLLSSLPVSPSRVLRAPGTSSYHLVPKHPRATWPRPEQSHLLPEACSPNGTDNRQQRQRQTERPPPEPSDILKRFYALYDIYLFIINMTLYLNFPKISSVKGLFEKMEFFLYSRISKFLRPAQRYNDFKLIRITCQAACHGKTEHGIFVK